MIQKRADDLIVTNGFIGDTLAMIATVSIACRCWFESDYQFSQVGRRDGLRPADRIHAFWRRHGPGDVPQHLPRTIGFPRWAVRRRFTPGRRLYSQNEYKFNYISTHAVRLYNPVPFTCFIFVDKANIRFLFLETISCRVRCSVILRDCVVYFYACFCIRYSNDWPRCAVSNLAIDTRLMFPRWNDRRCLA